MLHERTPGSQTALCPKDEEGKTTGSQNQRSGQGKMVKRLVLTVRA